MTVAAGSLPINRATADASFIITNDIAGGPYTNRAGRIQDALGNVNFVTANSAAWDNVAPANGNLYIDVEW